MSEKKRRPRPITSYADCFQVWETVLRTGSLKLSFPNKTKAIAFRLRMNVYRSLLREHNASLFAGAPATSAYDHFQIALRETELIIAMQSNLANVTITDQSGNPVVLEPAVPGSAVQPEPLAPQYLFSPPDLDDLPE